MDLTSDFPFFPSYDFMSSCFLRVLFSLVTFFRYLLDPTLLLSILSFAMFFASANRPFSYSEKNQNRTIDRTVFCYILSNFRICTILIEALTPLDRTSCIEMYKNNARSSLFCRIAKRSISFTTDEGHDLIRFVL